MADLAAGRDHEWARLVAVERAARERSDFLARVGQVMSRSLDLDELVEHIAGAAVPELADWCTLVVVLDQPERAPLRAIAHVDPAQVQWARRLQERSPHDPDAPTGIPRVIRTGLTEYIPDIDPAIIDAATDDPELRQFVRDLDLHSAVTVELRSPLGALGALQLMRTSQSASYTSAEVTLAEDLAKTISAALNNALLYRRQRRAQRALDTLQEFTGDLSTAVTVTDVARTVMAHSLAGVQANRGVLYRVSDDGKLVLLEATGHDPIRLAGWQELDVDVASPVTDAVRSAEPVVIQSREELARRYPRLDGSAQLDAAVIALPLQLRGRVTGGLVLGFTLGHGFDDDELKMLRTIAGRGAGAIERARLYEAQRDAALTLQRRLLPSLPEPPPWLAADARYLPATGGEVGGDWYQMLTFDDGRCVAALGDAVGRGIPAAAAMGQLRAALAGAAAVDPDPRSVVAATDVVAMSSPDTRAASLVYVLLTPGGHRCHFVSAGHPPMVLVRDGQSPMLLEGGRGLLLGVTTPRVPDRPATIDLLPGDTLILYSDGLIERRGEPIDDGLDRLLRAAERHRHLPTDELCDALLATLIGESETTDDVAILALRRAAT